VQQPGIIKAIFLKRRELSGVAISQSNNYSGYAVRKLLTIFKTKNPPTQIPMKKKLSPILFFLMGSVFMSMFLLVTRCEKYGSVPSDDINPDEMVMNIDYVSIKKAATDIEKALLTADQTVVDKLILTESLEQYKGKQEPYTSEELTQIGNGFKTRELTSATENFAEYTYTIDGIKYTMAMACEEEGIWKIIRY
jgi:hypothetical protein